MSETSFLDAIKWDDHGLVPAIAQDADSGQVLMMAWMNRQALEQTVALKRAVYWSRSRAKLWFKGEQSGHVQHVRDIRMDCDADVVLLSVQQVGGIACHTGRARCFYRRLERDRWVETEAPLKDPKTIYK